jgi:hypothetical protein
VYCELYACKKTFRFLDAARVLFEFRICRFFCATFYNFCFCCHIPPFTKRRSALPKLRHPRMLLPLKRKLFPSLLDPTCWRATVRMTSLVSLMVIHFSRECACVKGYVPRRTRERFANLLPAAARPCGAREERGGVMSQKTVFMRQLQISRAGRTLCCHCSPFFAFVP